MFLILCDTRINPTTYTCINVPVNITIGIAKNVGQFRPIEP